MKNFIFDEKLFLELCSKHDVKVINGSGKNILIEDGVKKEITTPLLKEILTGKSSFKYIDFCVLNFNKGNYKIQELENGSLYKINNLLAC